VDSSGSGLGSISGVF